MIERVPQAINQFVTTKYHSLQTIYMTYDTFIFETSDHQLGY